jgi:hypothetical protein
MRLIHTRFCALLIALFPSLLFAVTVTVTATPAGCGGASGTVTASPEGGLPPYSFLWSPVPPSGQGTSFISDLLPGSYTVTVTDGLGNTAEATGIVEDLPLLNTPNAMVLRSDCGGSCSGWAMINEADLGGTAPYTYDFPFPQVSGNYVTFLGLCGNFPGTAITATDANGCTVTFYPNVGAFNPSIPSISYTLPACGGDDNGVIAMADGFPSQAWYKVSNPSFDSIYEFAAPPYLITGLPAGSYSVELWDPNSPIEPGGGPVYCTLPTDVVVASIAPPCGQVTGTVYNDIDQDCLLDGSDFPLPYRVMTIEPGPIYAISDANGDFIAALSQGNYTLAQPLVSEVQLCPTQHPVPFALTTLDPDVNIELADSSLAPHDLVASIHPANNARPGFPTSVYVLLTNISAYPSGAVTITLNYDPILQNPSPANAQWTLPSFPPFGQGDFFFNALVPADITLLGTVLNYSVTVTNTATEASVANNTASTAVTITGSYDPNDKRGWTSSRSSEGQYFIDEDSYMEYTVRFQNTGTAAAETVVIRDVIDMDFDITSLDILGASHAFTPSFGEGRELVFTFNGINLPDSTTDLLGSQGFVSYRIKPNVDIMVGDVLENTAGIYFDFNPPIITNTTSHVVDFSTALNNAAYPVQQIVLSPNPATDRVLITGVHRVEVVEIHATDGRLIRTMSPTDDTFDVADLEPGCYLVHVVTKDGQSVVVRFTRA